MTVPVLIASPLNMLFMCNKHIVEYLGSIAKGGCRNGLLLVT